MKKKKVLFGAIFSGALAVAVAVGIVLSGCGKSTLARTKENMSEWTSVYYYGECENFSASLSSGVREDPYLLNGKSEKKVDFSLLSVTLKEATSDKLIKAKVKIDGVESEQELEINGLNPCFMVDLEKRMTGNETVEISYAGQTLSLTNLSKDFAIDDEKAIEIAVKEIEDKILENKVGNNLNSECYLRVLDKDANNFDTVFWCFTVINVKNESFNVVISTKDGSVLAKS